MDAALMKDLGPTAAVTSRQVDAWLLALALVLVVGGVFWPVLFCDFVSYDDPAYVTHHPMVNQGLRSAAVVWALTAPHSSNWNPVTSLSHQLDVSLFGLNPLGHHAMNLALHVLNTLLVLRLGRALGGGRWACLMVAGLFALHPLHVESVAWVSQRKDLLSTLFWLMALLAHVRERRVVVAVSAALAMLAKPMAVTLPLTLLVLDGWPLRRWAQRSWTSLVLEKTPLWLMSAAMVVITVLAQRADGAMDFHATLAWSTRLANALVSSVRYLGRMIWPGELSPFYPYPEAWSPLVVAGAAAVLVLVTAVAWRTRLTRPWLLAGWLGYGITLLPVSGLVQTGAHALADRYAYVPLLGLFVMVVGEAVAWSRAGGRWRGWLLGGMTAVVLFGCAWRSREQIDVWQTSDTLLARIEQVAGAHPVVFRERALALQLRGESPQVVGAQHELGAKLHPDDLFLLLQASMSRAQAGRFAEAYALVEKARALAPEHPGWEFNRGEILMLEGKPDEAVAALSAALEKHPRVGSGHGLIGRIRLRQGRVTEAVEAFQKASALDRWDWLSRNELGVALYQAGRLPEALKSVEAAHWINPGDAGVQQNLTALRQALKP